MLKYDYIIPTIIFSRRTDKSFTKINFCLFYIPHAQSFARQGCVEVHLVVINLESSKKKKKNTYRMKMMHYLLPKQHEIHIHTLMSHHVDTSTMGESAKSMEQPVGHGFILAAYLL